MQQWYKCSNCGAPVNFGIKFCGGCGTPLHWPAQEQTTDTYEKRFQKPRSRSKIAELPEISADFRSYVQGILVKGISIRKVDWVPCPRCGAKSAKPSRKAQVSDSGIGCVAVLLLVIIAMLAPILIPLMITMLLIWYAVAVVAAVAVIVVWIVLRKRRGHKYSCADCGFIWTSRDVEQYFGESNLF